MHRAVARTGLVGIAACALVGICAATTSSAPYHGSTDEISAVVAPAIWLVVAIVAVYAALAPSRRWIVNAATLTLCAVPALAIVGRVGYALTGLDVPAELQLSREPLDLYLCAVVVAAVYAIAVAVAACGLTLPARPGRSAPPC